MGRRRKSSNVAEGGQAGHPAHEQVRKKNLMQGPGYDFRKYRGLFAMKPMWRRRADGDLFGY